ncbi:restriction endonuclease subunit S [Microbulbifer mangrovi]|uniref:restriction endonuclease subunit S n=1 Tax=Microbulbifer mangrovi TaxID=927787 RepID=UPI0009909229|nr:restriction endonuclease subunit S [Microbulbifer mangrovi]
MSSDKIFDSYPDSWRSISLGELCADGGGAIQTGPFGSQLHARDYVKSGIPSIMPKNISVEGISTDDIAHISEADANRLSKYLTREGDIVYSRRGDVEKCSLVTAKEDGWLCGTGCLRVRLGNRAPITPVYLHAYLSHPRVRQWVSRHAIGATMPNLNTSILSSLPVLIPEKAQEKVVEDLWRGLTEKIKLNRRTNETLEQIAQTLFKSWFVDFDPVHAKVAVREHFEQRTAEYGEPLPTPVAIGEAQNIAAAATIAGLKFDPPNISDTRSLLEAELAELDSEKREQLKQLAAAFPSDFEETTRGKSPAGWQIRPLDTIAKYQNGLALQKYRPENESEFLPVLKIAQLKKGYTDGVEKASPNIKESCRVYDGDVIFSWSGSLVVDVWCGGDAALNQHLFKVTSKDYPKWFFYQFTKHHLCEFQRIAAAKAVTMGHIKREHLSQALCAVPPDDFLDLLTRTFAFLLEKGISLRLESRTLAEIRDQLLPKLLSGEIQLNPESAVEAN